MSTITKKANLEMRAARYFGVHDEPRTTVKLGRYTCIVVCTRMGREAVMFYDEELRRRGYYRLLTEGQRVALVAALTEEHSR